MSGWSWTRWFSSVSRKDTDPLRIFSIFFRYSNPHAPLLLCTEDCILRKETQRCDDILQPSWHTSYEEISQRQLYEESVDSTKLLLQQKADIARTKMSRETQDQDRENACLGRTLYMWGWDFVVIVRSYKWSITTASPRSSRSTAAVPQISPMQIVIPLVFFSTCRRRLEWTTWQGRPFIYLIKNKENCSG